MGKGDKKSKRGKISMGSYGVKRKRKVKPTAANTAAKPKVAKPKAEKAEAEAPAKKAPAKKAPAKKAAVKKEE